MQKLEHLNKSEETVRVQLFASGREKTGLEDIHLPVNQHTTMRDLLQLLHAAHPELRKISGRWAVNKEFVENDCSVHPEDEIAFIPPMSGG